MNTEGFETWDIDIQVLDDNPIYKDEKFRLRFSFNKYYPIEPPEVVFISVPSPAPFPESPDSSPPHPIQIPMHPHVYSNGIICIDMLSARHWSPVLTVEAVCISLQSMLTGNTRSERPEGDQAVCSAPQRPREMRFQYDDDDV